MLDPLPDFPALLSIAAALYRPIQFAVQTNSSLHCRTAVVCKQVEPTAAAISLKETLRESNIARHNNNTTAESAIDRVDRWFENDTACTGLARSVDGGAWERLIGEDSLAAEIEVAVQTSNKG
jgi:hypothetical protein